MNYNYDTQLKLYLSKHASTKPNTFTGAWAWYAQHKNDFDKLYNTQPQDKQIL